MRDLSGLHLDYTIFLNGGFFFFILPRYSEKFQKIISGHITITQKFKNWWWKNQIQKQILFAYISNILYHTTNTKLWVWRFWCTILWFLQTFRKYLNYRTSFFFALLFSFYFFLSIDQKNNYRNGLTHFLDNEHSVEKHALKIDKSKF